MAGTPIVIFKIATGIYPDKRNRLTLVKHGIDVPPFDALADPRVLAGLAAAAEERGWDGFFVWDHIVYRAPVRAVADPWVALAAVACATSSLRIGTMITPLSRRRVHKLARETATLDLLSSGRLTFGVGLGSARNGEFGPFGEVDDPRERARLLDQGLDDLLRYWAGEFQPVPVQRPRIPVWVAAEWPHRRPVRRALRFDGVFPTGLPGPEALAELVGEIREARPAGDPFDVVVDLPPGEDPEPWDRAGATWAVTDFGYHPDLTRVREVIDAGPPGPLGPLGSGGPGGPGGPAR
jgi:alkanesulfonate monooxygenase SsuD/methylene tetrahydromethanopterin reductase-like flavin-dependent oxidoreductase (luciferase family)